MHNFNRRLYSQIRHTPATIFETVKAPRIVMSHRAVPEFNGSRVLLNTFRSAVKLNQYAVATSTFDMIVALNKKSLQPIVR